MSSIGDKSAQSRARECRCADRAMVGAQPWDVGDPALIRVFDRLSGTPSGAVPVFARASILRPASQRNREFP